MAAEPEHKGKTWNNSTSGSVSADDCPASSFFPRISYHILLFLIVSCLKIEVPCGICRRRAGKLRRLLCSISGDALENITLNHHRHTVANHYNKPTLNLCADKPFWNDWVVILISKMRHG